MSKIQKNSKNTKKSNLLETRVSQNDPKNQGKSIRGQSGVKFRESGKEGEFNTFDITKMIAWVPGPQKNTNS